VFFVNCIIIFGSVCTSLFTFTEFPERAFLASVELLQIQDLTKRVTRGISSHSISISDLSISFSSGTSHSLSTFSKYAWASSDFSSQW